jgi:hypothetical protein
MRFKEVERYSAYDYRTRIQNRQTDEEEVEEVEK